MPINNSKNYQSMHEIVKYSPLFYDANGVFHKNEWTSCSEIGKSFDGKKLTTEEYFTTENNYILAMCEIIRVTGSAHMTVEYLEKDELWIEQRMKTSKIRVVTFANSIKGETRRQVKYKRVFRSCEIMLKRISLWRIC